VYFMTLSVRAHADPVLLQKSISAAIHSVNKDQALNDIRTVDQIKELSMATNRLQTTLLVVFGATALLLAGIGIYGVLSYTVRQRVQEIGIRMALGAASGDVVRMVLIEGLKPTLAGLAIGVAGAAALGRVLTSLVFGVTPRDATTFGVVSAVVLAVGLLACLVPAYRATRVDPLQALRAE
jgi:ABC-type antimicrobial peptide transport system permease subunit